MAINELLAPFLFFRGKSSTNFGAEPITLEKVSLPLISWKIFIYRATELQEAVIAEKGN